MCKPILSPPQHPHPCCSSGPVDKEVRLRTGQLCLGSHFSVTEGADHGPEAAQKPSQPPFPPPLLACPGNPSRASQATSKPGHRRCRLCLSLSRPAKSLSSSSLLVLSREPPPATWHSGSTHCSECVCVPVCMCVCVYSVCACVCVHVRGCTFGSVLRYMPGLLFEYCSSRCV